MPVEVLMPTELPLVCSLSAIELPKRLEEIADLGRAALHDVHDQGRRAQLRFAAGVGIRERIDAIVAAESECCAFLTMRVSDEPDAILLTIDATAGAEPVIVELLDSFCRPAAHASHARGAC